ncbi:MAG: RnfABCDGE type electron transport complex subunit D [Planctomycetaceae bacterium]|nr:RnfABCDGE type electron transport complex subunit D [Planctomycetaceae bacterium]
MKFLRKIFDNLHPQFAHGGKLERYYPLYEAIDTFLFTPPDVTRGPTHVRDHMDLKRVMITVVAALTPCILMALYNTGYQANLAIEHLVEAGDLSPGDIPGWRSTILSQSGLGFSSANPLACLVHGALYFLPVFLVTQIAGGFWEVLFAFLAWKGRGRTAMLGLGIIFHVMTYFMLGLIVFPLLFMTLYATFFEERELVAARNWLWSRLPSRLPHLQNSASPQRRSAPSPTMATLLGLPAFGTLLAVIAFVAVEAEARMDVYRTRNPEGPSRLQPLSQEEARQLLRNDVALRPQDKVFSFDIGTTTVGGVLANRCREFQQRDILVAQCTLVPPHEDLWVEVNLHDATDHVIERNGVVAPREEMRANLFYQLRDSLEPGPYHLVLRIHGQEVGRRTIQLQP